MAKKKEKLTPVPLRRPNRNHAIGTAKPTLPPPGPDLSHIAEQLRALAVPTAGLAFLADNPLDHDDAEIEEMRAALRRYGQLVPLVVNKRTTPPTVAGGNKRLRAALADGWQHVAVVEVDLPEDEAAALAVTLNATQGTNWNNDLLQKAMARMGKLDLGERMSGMMERLREARGLLSKQQNAAAPQLSESLQHKIIVSCRDEAHQAELLERFETEGIDCKALII